ncbi:MAG: DoxX family protein [Pseudonocardiaceae bacterium]
MMSARRPTAAAGMVLLLTSTGVLHFAVPASFDAIVPERLPGAARTWTHVTGVAELVIAALIATPRTRRLGGLLAALLFVGVFPANVKMAIDWSDRPVWMRALAYGRLPLQIPLVLWAVLVCRRAGKPGLSHRTLATPRC